MLLFQSNTVAAETIQKLDVLGEEITIQQFAASGDQLIIYIAPSYGFHDRSKDVARVLSELGLEIWMVDLIDNFFLTRSVESIREIDARYVAGIIEQAYIKTGKNVTLLTSSYGAIPSLRGARQWQLNNPGLKNVYLNGVIMFSPELYRGIPVLGEDPAFEPIASATNIPIMIYQSELRNNRWQLQNVVKRLESGNAVVYQKILPDIASFFYQITEEADEETKEAIKNIPRDILRVIKLLQSTPSPVKAAELVVVEDTKTVGLDSELRDYKGNKTPKPLDLEDLNGKRFVRRDFKNKVTVVNFWATWCPPCVEEIPMLNRLKSAMEGQNFELLSVNFGEKRDVIRKFIEKVNIEFPVLLDEGGRVSGEWNTLVLPSTFVIGPDGKFAYTVNAAIEWDRPAVIKAMKELANQSQ